KWVKAARACVDRLERFSIASYEGGSKVKPYFVSTVLEILSSRNFVRYGRSSHAILQISTRESILKRSRLLGCRGPIRKSRMMARYKVSHYPPLIPNASTAWMAPAVE